MSSGSYEPDGVPLLLEQQGSQQQAAQRVVARDHPHKTPSMPVSQNPNFRRRLPPTNGLFSSSTGDSEYPTSHTQGTSPRRTGSFLLHGRVNPLINHYEINRRQRRSSVGAYEMIKNDEPIHNVRFPPPPRTPTPPPPPPSPLPSATPMDWLGGSTRKEQYESVDRANKGLRGLWKKVLRKVGVRKEDDEIKFYEEGKDDTGSVRRYRLDLDEQGNVKDTNDQSRQKSKMTEEVVN